MNIMDFANDDNFNTAWVSNSTVKAPWLEVVFPVSTEFNTVVVTEHKKSSHGYSIDYLLDGQWHTITGVQPQSLGKVHIFRFEKVRGEKVKLRIDKITSAPEIAEFAIYQERR